MALPKKLQRLIDGINSPSELEQRMVRRLTKRLQNDLGMLERIAGSSCAKDLYEDLIQCIFSQGTTSCISQGEEYLERCITTSLRRPLTEAEEQMIGYLVGDITDITEILLGAGGITLIDDEPDEEEPIVEPGGGR